MTDLPADPQQVALVYNSPKNPQKCGHAVPLADIHSKTVCPVCHEPIALIRDGLSKNVVIFKHGKKVYELSVFRSWNWIDWLLARQWTAQERIASALQLSLKEMKILYKGKVLYPSTWTGEAISSRLLELSNRPPVLLVMGTPTSQHATLPNKQGLWDLAFGMAKVLLCHIKYMVYKAYGIVQPLLPWKM